MPLDFSEGMPIPIRRDMPAPPAIFALEPSPDGDNHPPRTAEEQQTADAVFSAEERGVANFFGIWAGAQVWGDWAGDKKRQRAEEEEKEKARQTKLP